MAVRIDRSARRLLRETNDLLLQVQKSSDPEAATAAVRRAAEDVAALDGGWESAFGLSPGDTNGPRSVGVTVAPTGPVLSVDAGHTPDDLIATIPSIIVRRLEEAGVTSAVVAVPRQSETVAYLHHMPRAVLLRAFVPPPPMSASPRAIPTRWLEEAFAWLTADVGPDHELWALAQPTLELALPIAEARQLFTSRRCLLVAGNQPTDAPSRRAKAEGWTEDQRRADALERMGGRIRFAEPFGGLTLAFGGPDASDDELLHAFDELRAIARRLAPEVVYSYLAIVETFDSVLSERLHHWSPLAPQSPPSAICDVVVYDAFPAQVLGPGHVDRLGGIPPRAEPLAGGRVELVLGDAASWLPTRRDRGRALLSPCILTDRREVERLTHQRYAGSIRLSDARARELKRRLWMSYRQPARPLDEVLADPTVLTMVRRVAQGEPGETPLVRFQDQRFMTATPTDRLSIHPSSLQSPVSLHLYPPPPSTFDAAAGLSTEVLEAIGAWAADGSPEKVGATIDWHAFRLEATDAPKFLPYCSTAGSSERSSLVGVHDDGLVRIVLHEPGVWGTTITLVGGRLAGAGPPLGSAEARAEVLATFDEMTAFARSVAPALGYACVTIDDVRSLDLNILKPLCDELVLDAFPFQILGPGHLQRLGSLPRHAAPLEDGKVELRIGQLSDWIPEARDAGRRLLAPCLVTEAEARAIEEARRASAG